jgi:hypothetical protein
MRHGAILEQLGHCSGCSRIVFSGPNSCFSLSGHSVVASWNKEEKVFLFSEEISRTYTHRELLSLTPLFEKKNQILTQKKHLTPPL